MEPLRNHDFQFASIPCLDLAVIEEAQEDKRKNLLTNLLQIFKTIGFAAIHVPNLHLLEEKVFQGAREFFSLENKTIYGSYSPYQQEKLRNETIEIERYRYMPGMQLPEILKDIEEIGKEYNQLARRLGILIAEGLGLNADELVISDKYYTVCLNHYPNSKNNKKGDVVYPHHRDISPITILARSAVGGLQVKVNEVYQDIIVPEGFVIVNTGDLLCNKTAGLFCGADHRVVKKEDWPEEGRYQVAVFNNFPKGFSLNPIPSLLEESLKKMKEAFVGQFIYGVEGDNSRAYNYNVIGDLSNASPEKINDLIYGGFLRNPNDQIVQRFSDCDWEKTKQRNKQLKEVKFSLFEDSII